MNAKTTVIGSAMWAAGFLTSAIALRGHPIGDWIEGGLLAGWVVFVALATLAGRPGCSTRPANG